MRLMQQDSALRFALCAVAPLSALTDDPTVIEILVTGTQEVFVERLGSRPEPTDIRLSQDQLDGIVANLANLSRKTVDLHGGDGHLIVSTRLPGFRVEAQLPPVAVGGPYVTIRRLNSMAMSLEEYVARGTLTQELAEFLRAAVQRRANILVSGGTSTGKTTFLNSLVREVDPADVLLTIETVQELVVPHRGARRFEADDEQGYGVQRLVKSALRSRPDRILIGEVRGGEAFDLLDAANSGHPGSMASLHANGAMEAIERFENLILEGRPAMPLPAVKKRIADTFELVVHMERVVRDGRFIRRLGEIVAIEGYDRVNDTYQLKSVFSTQDL
jgi:pilus assembly protein CpaF